MKENETDRQVVAAVEAWKHADFLCRNYLLNGLNNTLYNVYCAFNTVRELWESLDKKYKTEDAGLKKFVVGKFLDYKMLDSKTVISQVQDLQVILHDICHTPIPGPTRLDDPNRVWGARLRTGTLYLIFFFKKPNWYLWV